jgi:hypothetical protein
MSIHLLDHVWATSRHKGSQLLLLLALADYAADDGLAFPSIATLAHKTRLKERNVHYLVKSLSTPDDLEAPEPELRVAQKAGPQRCNLYALALPIMAECVHCCQARQDLRRNRMGTNRMGAKFARAQMNTILDLWIGCNVCRGTSVQGCNTASKSALRGCNGLHPNRLIRDPSDLKKEIDKCEDENHRWQRWGSAVVCSACHTHAAECQGPCCVDFSQGLQTDDPASARA